MILLTKQINDILDTKKLPELTVLRTDAGTLSLVGRECGKEILNFSSMPISKKLTVQEREILMDDYLVPVLFKHGKDLNSLITLMKDRTLDDDVEAYKKAMADNEEYSLTKNTHYQHSSGKTVTSGYFIKTKFDDDEITASVNYSVDKGAYSAHFDVIQPNGLFCVNEMKNADKVIKAMVAVLDVWKDKNEALDVKNEHVAKLQESMKIKCSL